MLHRDGARGNLANQLSFIRRHGLEDEMPMRLPAVRLGNRAFPLHAPGVRQSSADATAGSETSHQKLQKKIDSRSWLSELRGEKTGKISNHHVTRTL